MSPPPRDLTPLPDLLHGRSLALGAHLSRRVDIPARDAGRIVDAVSFLGGVASGERPVIGRRVAVYGGGNTAMDAARVARRLGADEALIVYRRTREQMPAHEEEAEDAEREGVRINWLRTITAFDGPELKVELMELDESGFPRPTGRFETLAADTVILALGQQTDTGFLRQVPGVEFQPDGTVRVSASLMTGCPGVFAGGDMVPSERTVTVGVGHGKKAARHIDAWLRGVHAARPPKHELATFDRLHPWYFGDAARRQQPQLAPEQRVAGFEEVVGGLSAREAAFEAGRCLSCGNCCECDGCLGACPEDAVIKLGVGHRYRFDYDRCTGCGACFEQCPVHAIEMVPESLPPPVGEGRVPKKDLALQAIAYGNVYVARVAMGADPQQTLRALREAEAYDGPSLVIAYSHCIAHGIEMRSGLDQQYRAVASGYWPLVRYDPMVRAAGGNPFLLDSPRPRIALSDYAYRELRYRTLANTNPAEAERLLGLAQQAVDQRWDMYEEMATRGAQHYRPW